MAREKIQRKTDGIVSQAELKDNEKIIQFFTNNIFKNIDVKNLFKWKFDNNPVNKTMAVIAKNSEDAVVAGCFFMPWKLHTRNGVVDAVQWADMFIQLEYRGNNLDTQMLDKFRNSILSICFAFPNKNGVMVHKKQGGIHLGNIVRYTKPLDVEYLVERFIKIKFIGKIISFILNICLKFSSLETYKLSFNKFRIEKVTNCAEEYDQLWDKFIYNVPDKIISCKDSKYINWKYLNTPNQDRHMYALRKNGVLCGFVVLDSYPDMGCIVDILALDSKAFDDLISFSLKYFRRKKNKSVVIMALENNVYANQFKKYGFVARPDIKHFYIYLNDNIADKEYYLDPKNWIITIGDCDIDRI